MGKILLLPHLPGSTAIITIICNSIKDEKSVPKMSQALPTSPLRC